MRKPIKKPATLKEAIDLMTKAWAAEDYNTAQFYLGSILKSVPLDALEQVVIHDLDTALGFFKLFVLTGFDAAPKGTVAEQMYLKIIRYIMEHATPGLKQVARQELKENPPLIPVGFEDGKDIYRLSDLALAIGLTEVELLARIKNPSCLKILPDGPRQGTTIH